MDFKDYLLLALAFGLAGVMVLGFRVVYVHEYPLWDILNAGFVNLEFLGCA